MEPENNLTAIWTPDYFRLFLCHKAEEKMLATGLKAAMDYYGVSCFVAHEDIEPTKEWQVEIEKALFSMHALAALITPEFHKSDWVDQEIGIALGRPVEIIPIRYGRDPYGFIGKYQGLQGLNKKVGALANEIYELMWTKEVLKEALTNSLVARFENSGSYGQSNMLVDFLERIDLLSSELVYRLDYAFQANSQLSEAWKVKTKLPGLLKKFKTLI